MSVPAAGITHSKLCILKMEQKENAPARGDARLRHSGVYSRLWIDARNLEKITLTLHGNVFPMRRGLKNKTG